MNDLQKKLAELEEQNRTLRESMKKIQEKKQEINKTPRCERQEYKGNKVLYFQGGHRPFYLGVGKLKTIVTVIDEIKNFVAKHQK